MHLARAVAAIMARSTWPPTGSTSPVRRSVETDVGSLLARLGRRDRAEAAEPSRLSTRWKLTIEREDDLDWPRRRAADLPRPGRRPGAVGGAVDARLDRRGQGRPGPVSGREALALEAGRRHGQRDHRAVDGGGIGSADSLRATCRRCWPA
jgi:hypothetical protein